MRETNTIHSADPNKKLPIQTMGMAPLTSMFWYGKSSEKHFDDYRPEVHDSDGLLIHMGSGEMLWRPLDDPPEMRHQVFAGKDIRGFGLFQRERNFECYQDIFNYYHKAPSVWVEPRGNWGEGAVHLVELSTVNETLDNIVAFWDPKNKPKPMTPFRFAYTMYFTKETDMRISENRVTATRIGVDRRDSSQRQFVVDFDGPRLTVIPDNSPPTAIPSCSDNANITFCQVYPNPFNHSWRVIINLRPKPDSKDPVDLRCTLKVGDEVVSETWTYLWSPP
jgi:glucans biosynthesis protein